VGGGDGLRRVVDERVERAVLIQHHEHVAGGRDAFGNLPQGVPRVQSRLPAVSCRAILTHTVYFIRDADSSASAFAATLMRMTSLMLHALVQLPAASPQSHIMSQNVWDNLIANLITTLLLTAAGLCTLALVFVIYRRGLFRFFGISRKNPNIRIYLSRLQIQPRGAAGLEEVTHGSMGAAINESEFRAALILRDRFRSKLVGFVPDSLRKWLNSPLIALSTLDPVIEISPPGEAGFIPDNLILIGSGVYNSISRKYLDPKTSCLSFAKDETGRRYLLVCRPDMPEAKVWRLLDQESSAPPVRNEIGIVQRVNVLDENRKDRKFSVFICAGMGSGATYGAVKYLNENWRKLFKLYQDREFSVYLTFLNLDPESTPTKDPVPTFVTPPVVVR
jgi:hypothetical protein